MHYRNDIIELRRGQNFLAVRRETIGGEIRYIGSVDGLECVTGVTREAAVSSLIRRAIHQSADSREAQSW